MGADFVSNLCFQESFNPISNGLTCLKSETEPGHRYLDIFSQLLII